MNMKEIKEKRSLIGMVLNIIASLFYSVSLQVIIAEVFQNGTSGYSILFLLYAAFTLGFSVYTLLEDKKEGLNFKSSILAIIGNAIYLIGGAQYCLSALVLTIIASVFYGIDNDKSKN